MRMSRRMFKLGVLSLAALSLGVAAAGGGGQGTTGPSAARLERDLASGLAENPTNARFTVPAFERHIEPGGGVRLEAQVQLDWDPGMRLRVLQATGSTDEEAYAALRSAAADLFAGVVPGFQRPPVAV